LSIAFTIFDCWGLNILNEQIWTGSEVIEYLGDIHSVFKKNVLTQTHFENYTQGIIKYLSSADIGRKR
jgi:hypothetical protein